MLADGSKFGDVALSTVVPISQVATIVTDASADPAEVDRITREGVEVILVNSGGPAPLPEDNASAAGDNASAAEDAPLAVGQ